MIDDFQRFLQSGPDVVRESDQAAQRLRDQKDEEERLRLAQRDVLEQNWIQSKKALDSIILKINQAFHSVGVELRISAEQNIAPAIARFQIELFRNNKYTNKCLKINVSGLGKQQVFSSDADEKMLGDLPRIGLCSDEDYARLLMRFLEPKLANL